MIMVYNRNSFRYFQNGIHALLLRGKIFKGETFKSAQRFYTDGYYHRHFSPGELTECLAKEGLSVDKITITYMNAQMFYKWPKALDDYLKDKIGWLLVAEFTKKVKRLTRCLASWNGFLVPVCPPASPSPHGELPPRKYPSCTAR